MSHKSSSKVTEKSKTHIKEGAPYSKQISNGQIKEIYNFGTEYHLKKEIAWTSDRENSLRSKVKMTYMIWELFRLKERLNA